MFKKIDFLKSNSIFNYLKIKFIYFINIININIEYNKKLLINNK